MRAATVLALALIVWLAWPSWQGTDGNPNTTTVSHSLIP